MSRFRFPLIVGALVAMAACKEAAAPKGTPGDLTARAYVDRDASGTFTAADSALAGVQITATPTSGSDATPMSATTDATGLATFADLEPGSYTVAIAAGQPTGAILTTNPTPTVGVSSQGKVTGSADFRFSFQPGSLTGRIFRDDNGSGSYDASDTPGANFLVTLRAATNGAPGAIVDTVRTDANGVWLFPRLAPGTYYVELENPGTIVYVGGGTQQVVVAPAVQGTVSGLFTGSLVIPIAQARTRAAGSNVEIEGILTVAPGMFTVGTGSVNSELWVQDASGGIAALQVPTNATLGLTVGKRVKVSGVRFDNAGQAQVGGPTTGATITIRAGADSVISVQPIDITQAVARTGFEGELVSLSGFTVTSVPTPAAGADYTVTGTVNGTSIQVRVEGSTGIAPTTFSVGNRYVVTGILSQFNGTTQLKPRSAADITGATPIATVRAAASGAFTVSGTLTVAPGSIVSGTNGVNSEIWVQDATGGIAVFSVLTANAAGLALGDIVEVTGTRSVNAAQIQLANPGLTVTRLSSGTPLNPRPVTGTELIAKTYDGQLVRLSGFTVTTVGTASAVGAFTVTGTGPLGEPLQIRVGGSGTGIVPADFTVGSVYTVTGVASLFNATVQLKPRMKADIVAGVIATPARVIINEFMANPATTTDPAGEYIELYNAGGTAQDLTGWRVLDINGTTGAINGADTIGTSSALPAALVIQPGEYLLMVHNTTVTTSGPFTAARYKYAANIQLNNSGTQPIVLKDAAGVTVDSVAYVSPTGVSAGIARGVVNPALDNSDANVNWADQTTVFSTVGANSERGTPGTVNDGAVITAPAIRRAVSTATPAVRATTTSTGGAGTTRR